MKTSSASQGKRFSRYSLANNGKPDATVSIDSTKVSSDENTQILLAAYPLSYSRKCKNVGVIGLGSGMTASVLLESESIEHMDIVEIEARVIDAAKLMGPKVGRVFSDERSAIHIDDAKTFFSASWRKYDLIISEPSNPWVSGVASLFSVEFFELIRKHLTPEGMLVQWFHLYEMSPELVASIVMSIDKNFLDYKAFICGTDMIVIASNFPIMHSPNDRALKNKKIASMLREISIEHPYDFQSNYIGGKKSLFYLVDMFEIPLNSDYNPILDLKAVKARILNASAGEYSKMNRFIIPVRKMIEEDTTTSFHAMSDRKINGQDPNFFNINADYEAWQSWFRISSRGTPRESFADSVVSRRVALKVAMIRMAARDSSLAAHQIWPKYVLDLLKATMPYLPAAQMKDIWEFIDEEGAHLALPPKSRDMLAVLKSITFQNDLETAQALSRRLMGRGPVEDNEHNRMFCAVYLISSIQLNELDGVPELWERIGDMRYDFNLTMLYNYAYYRKRERQSRMDDPAVKHNAVIVSSQ